MDSHVETCFLGSPGINVFLLGINSHSCGTGLITMIVSYYKVSLIPFVSLPFSPRPSLSPPLLYLSPTRARTHRYLLPSTRRPLPEVEQIMTQYSLASRIVSPLILFFIDTLSQVLCYSNRKPSKALIHEK